ncbi:hypothetical protein MYX07_03590 [Patescibacteria group bacterium AH-259-L07]|nr:hypothetical protein [Patescibacteria group bacterium AH-259-L07]
MQNNINISQLCISNPKESNSYSRIYIADPEKKFLEKFGKLAILISIHFKGVLENDTLSHTKEWIQNFIDFTSSNFYKTLRTGSEIEKEFEDLLQSLNKWLAKEKVQASELFEKYIDELDIEVIALKNTTVYFATIGEIKTYLLSGTSEGKLQKLSAGKNKATKFSNLMSGSLEKDNVLLFASPNLFDYFSTKKIIQVFQVQPLKNAMHEIKQLLSDDLDRINILFLAISHRDESLIVQSPEDEFNQKEPDKEKISVEVDKEKEPEEEILPTIISRSTHLAKTFITIGQKVLAVLTKIFQKIKKLSTQKRPLKLRAPRKIKTHGIMWQKTLFIILIIFGFLFVISIIILGSQEYKAQQKREYAQTIQKLKDIESELSIALIYEDESNLQTLLTQMKQLLNSLPQVTKEQKQTYELLYTKYSTTLHKFYRITTIDEPTLLIDLGEQYKNIDPSGMTNLFNNFYIFDGSNNYIYRFNVETEETEMVNNTSANVGRLQKLAPLDNDILIGYDQNQGIATFNTIDAKLEPVKLTRQHDISEITDLSLYNGRLYVLESSQNQIYKYSKTIDGFGKEEIWVKDGTNIADTLSFTIDGSIYVLKKSSDIYKFFRNNRVAFELDDIKPALSTTDPNIITLKGNIKLFTTADMKYLYLLDGPTNRLIKLLKDGKLIKQFTSPQFNNLIDFLVSRNENTAWLLNGTKIYEISL